jgi:hypothetical protein
MHAARAKAAGFPGPLGAVFESDAERLARAFVSAQGRLAYDFDVPRQPPWAELPGRSQAFLTEVFRQLIIEGRIPSEEARRG